MRLLQTVVLEGPNRAGKSRLKSELEERFGWRSLHTGGPKTTEVELLNALDAFSGPRPIVLDRHPSISQVVYDRTLDRPTLVADDVLRRYLVMRMARPLVLYCRPTLARMLTLEMRSSPNRDLEHTRQVQQNFHVLVHQYDIRINELVLAGAIRVIHYNWEEHAQDWWFSMLSRMMREAGLCAD